MPDTRHFSLYSKSIGTVTADGSSVSAQGGPTNPQLVIPLTVQLDHQPKEAPLAVLRLQALLGTDQNVSVGTAVCPPATVELVGGPWGFRLFSRPTGQHPTRVDIRFFLTQAQVAELERRRHAAGAGSCNLYLRVEPTVVGLRNFNEYNPGQQPASPTWGAYGEYSELAVFWVADSWVLPIEIPTSNWVQKVLPGLGFDRVRLQEVILPPPLPGQPNAATQLDEARAALDACRYEDCVAACRGVLELWERHLGASRARPVAKIIADRLNWAADDPKLQFVDCLWKSARDITNATHHVPDAPRRVAFTHKEAELAFMLVVLLSGYLGRAVGT